MKRFFCMLCAVMLCVTMTGCGIGDKPEAPVNGFCTAMKEFDLKAMNDYLAVEDGTIDALLENTDETYERIIEMIEKYSKEMTYTITDTQKDGESATVSVEFEYVDISEIVNEAMRVYVQEMISSQSTDLSEEEMMERFMEIVEETSERAELEKLTATADFACVKTEEGWKIDQVPQEALTVLTGNLQNVGY